jgi:hypothetical protein
MTKLLAAVAAYGTQARIDFPDRPLSAERWARLADGVRDQRLEGLLAAAVSTGALPVDGAQHDSVRDLARGRAQVDLSIERETVKVSQTLGRAGVHHRVLKGPASAHRFYPDPSWRGFGDVDLLIDNADWYRAVEVLEELGARRIVPEIRPGFDRKFGKDATLVSAAGMEIDLHRTLVFGPYGLWVDLTSLLARAADTITVAGSHLPVLDAEAAFVHACYNAVLADDPPRLIAVRDVIQIAVGEAIDGKKTHELAEAWRASGVVSRAIRLVARCLNVDLSATSVGAAFQSASETVGDRALMLTYRGSGRGYTSQLAGVVAVRGLAQRVAYLSALVWPQPAYLEARGWSAASYARHALKKVVGRP